MAGRRTHVIDTGSFMAKQTSEGNKSSHRRRRRKPTPSPDTVVEPEPAAGKPQETASTPELAVFVYTYTVWNRFPNARDN